jgi:hypothetical protein
MKIVSNIPGQGEPYIFSFTPEKTPKLIEIVIEPYIPFSSISFFPSITGIKHGLIEYYDYDSAEYNPGRIQPQATSEDFSFDLPQLNSFDLMWYSLPVNDITENFLIKISYNNEIIFNDIISQKEENYTDIKLRYEKDNTAISIGGGPTFTIWGDGGKTIEIMPHTSMNDELESLVIYLMPVQTLKFTSTNQDVLLQEINVLKYNSSALRNSYFKNVNGVITRSSAPEWEETIVSSLNISDYDGFDFIYGNYPYGGVDSELLEFTTNPEWVYMIARLDGNISLPYTNCNCKFIYNDAIIYDGYVEFVGDNINRRNIYIGLDRDGDNGVIWLLNGEYRPINNIPLPSTPFRNIEVIVSHKEDELNESEDFELFFHKPNTTVAVSLNATTLFLDEELTQPLSDLTMISKFNYDNVYGVNEDMQNVKMRFFKSAIGSTAMTFEEPAVLLPQGMFEPPLASGGGYTSIMYFESGDSVNPSIDTAGSVDFTGGDAQHRLIKVIYKDNGWD